MSFLEILLISFALAMDCFTVCTVAGMLVRQFRWGPALRMAFFFGLFQALMPLAGWLLIHYFRASVAAYDHWIAFGMLLGIGVKMISDAFRGGDAPHIDPASLKTVLLMSVATSIDALAVGISMACSGYEDAGLLTVPLAVIGVVSFLLALLGWALGVYFGDSVAKRVKPELLGGIILIGIGIKILVEHLFLN